MYQLLDCGFQKKLERFGSVVIQRPCFQALWKPSLEKWKWDAAFERSPDQWKGRLPSSWKMEYAGLKWDLRPNSFGHVGIFPEHKILWDKIEYHAKQRPMKMLNLFAYNGAASLIAAQHNAQVTHVDASKKSVTWARDNALLNGLGEKPIRWIVDDVIQFLKREIRRQNHYDGIICDPPSFGKGSEHQVFKIEKDLPLLVDLCVQVLSPKPSFLILSAHTPGITDTVLGQMLKPYFPKVFGGELFIESKEACLPSGFYASWEGT